MKREVVSSEVSSTLVPAFDVQLKHRKVEETPDSASPTSTSAPADFSDLTLLSVAATVLSSLQRKVNDSTGIGGQGSLITSNQEARRHKPLPPSTPCPPHLRRARKPSPPSTSRPPHLRWTLPTPKKCPSSELFCSPELFQELSRLCPPPRTFPERKWNRPKSSGHVTKPSTLPPPAKISLPLLKTPNEQSEQSLLRKVNSLSPDKRLTALNLREFELPPMVLDETLERRWEEKKSFYLDQSVSAMLHALQLTATYDDALKLCSVDEGDDEALDSLVLQRYRRRILEKKEFAQTSYKEYGGIKFFGFVGKSEQDEEALKTDEELVIECLHWKAMLY